MNLEQIVLSGMKYGSQSRWQVAILQLNESHFVDERLALWKSFVKIFQRTGCPVTQQMFELAISTMTNKSLAAELNMAWNDLEEDPGEGHFLMAVHQLEEHRLDRAFNSTIAQGLEISARGLTVEGKRLEGREAARDFLISKLPELRSVNGHDMVDAIMEGDEVKKEYEQAKKGDLPGVKTYIGSIDSNMRLLEIGDLMLVLGFTGDGKTQLCLNIAHNNVVHGKNVLYITTETVRERIRRRFWSRHSKEPQFKIPLPYSDIKHGTLTTSQEKAIDEINADLINGRRAGKYGAFYVVGASKGLSQVPDRVNETRRLAGSCDLVIVDYLALIASSFERIDLVQTVTDCKAAAVSNGVPLITPWQTTLTAWQQAKKTGYTKGAMAETSEAEKSSDFVLTILKDENDKSKLIGKFTKARDEDEGQPFELTADFAYSWIGDNKSSLGGFRF